MTDREIDQPTGTRTTGHEWDGIKELDTPLPRWWLWTFYACIAFALVYTVLYPAWPLVSSATQGVLGYSSRATLDADLASAQAAQGTILARIDSTPVAGILADEDLARFARAGGRSLFKVNCIQCHGTGAEGSPGYPNLNDDEWIWGGSIDQIYQTITHGSRFMTDADTHYNIMPNFGADGILTPQQIVTVAKQVASFSGMAGGEATPEGAQIFADQCAACHGPDGHGNADMGAPSLADPIWLYNGTLEGIEAQVTKPRHGVMPAWAGRLSDGAIKQLAVYVYSLGGGK